MSACPAWPKPSPGRRPGSTFSVYLNAGTALPPQACQDRAIHGSARAAFDRMDPPMSGSGTETPGNGEQAMPNLQVVAQYIKDLSFENPGAPSGLTARPQIELGVDLQARRGDAEHFEVEMKLRVTAKGDDKPLFLLELAYAGLFRLTNIPEEAVQQILLIQ